MPTRIFVSYAREDEGQKDELLAALGPLEGVEIWHDRKLIAGTRFGEELSRQIRSAHIVLLLVSKDFFASEWCGREVEQARARPRARVIPVILEEVDWSALQDLSAAPTDGRPIATWKSREDGLRDAARLIREALPRHRDVEPNLPRRNVNFTGREDLLARLHDAMIGESRAIVRALAGMGGAGKTELAAEYAHRHPGDYSFIWWVHAGDPTKLAFEYAALARALGLPEHASTDQNAIVEAVKRELEASEHWLLVFDSVVKPEDLERFLPVTTSGRVLVTTRHQAWGRIGKTIDVDVMTREDAVALLVSRSGAEDSRGANELAEVLGDLAIALEQAAAYIEQNAKSFADFVRLFQTRHRKELSSVVATTLGLSFDRIQETHPAAADLLKLYAFLAPQDIPRSMLSDAAPRVPEELQALAGNELLLDGAMKTLLCYSAVRAEESSLDFHPLAQLTLRDRLSAEETGRWATGACVVVNGAFPMQPEDSREWGSAARLLAHVRAACEAAEQAGADNDDAAPLLNRAAIYLRHRGELAAALETYQAVERWLLRFHGPDAPALLVIRSNAATLQEELGDRTGTIEVYRRKLEHDRRTLGDLHPEVAVDLSNLGTGLVVLHRAEEGLPFLREAEALLQQLGVEQHAETHATIQSNLGIALDQLGDREAARQALETALQIREKVYGRDNAKLVRILYNLGRILAGLGETQRAGELFVRGLGIAEQRLEPNSSDTLLLRLELAVHEARTGDVKAAMTAFLEAFNAMLEHHTAAASQLDGTVEAFAAAAEARGDRGVARQTFETMLEVKEKLYGGDDAKLVPPLYSLGRILVREGEWQRAGELFVRGLGISEQRLEPDSPSTLLLRLEVAVHEARTGNVEAALAAFQQAFGAMLEHYDPVANNLDVTVGEFAAAAEAHGYSQLAAQFNGIAAQISAMRG